MHHTQKIENNLPKIFSLEDMTKLLKIKRESARVLAARFVKKDIIHRIKRNLYVTVKMRDHLSINDHYVLARKILQPSYISFKSALIYHGMAIGGKFHIESCSAHKSHEFRFGVSYVYTYHRLPKKLFFGFGKNPYGLVIATPEKALLDILYMMSLGRYFVHFNSVNLERMSFVKLLHHSKKYPKRTQKLLFRLFKRSIKRNWTTAR